MRITRNAVVVLGAVKSLKRILFLNDSGVREYGKRMRLIRVNFIFMESDVEVNLIFSFTYSKIVR